jgi:glycine/D-amino acid oxidase-like deaminating enzyme
MAKANETHPLYDVIVVGGGPAGLSAALALGRARKRVLVCDSGPRRNAAAERVYNFVTRDGTPPDQFRQIARQQLQTYSNVEVRDVRVASISGSRGALRAQATGMDAGRRLPHRRRVRSHRCDARTARSCGHSPRNATGNAPHLARKSTHQHRARQRHLHPLRRALRTPPAAAGRPRSRPETSSSTITASSRSTR